MFLLRTLCQMRTLSHAPQYLLHLYASEMHICNRSPQRNPNVRRNSEAQLVDACSQLCYCQCSVGFGAPQHTHASVSGAAPAHLHALAIELGLHDGGVAMQLAVRILHTAGHRSQHRPRRLPRRQVLRSNMETISYP